jgi:hypothetical protein
MWAYLGSIFTDEWETHNISGRLLCCRKQPSVYKRHVLQVVARRSRYGPIFAEMRRWIRDNDRQNRPVQYEPSGSPEDVSDVFCPMYPCEAQYSEVRKRNRRVCSTFHTHENDHFTKTGSGQTWGRHSERPVFCTAVACHQRPERDAPDHHVRVRARDGQQQRQPGRVPAPRNTLTYTHDAICQ